MSDVFDFNVSYNDFVPFPPILFTVDVTIKEMSELLMDAFCVSSFAFTVQIEFNECCV